MKSIKLFPKTINIKDIAQKWASIQLPKKSLVEGIWTKWLHKNNVIIFSVSLGLDIRPLLEHPVVARDHEEHPDGAALPEEEEEGDLLVAPPLGPEGEELVAEYAEVHLHHLHHLPKAGEVIREGWRVVLPMDEHAIDEEKGEEGEGDEGEQDTHVEKDEAKEGWHLLGISIADTHGRVHAGVLTLHLDAVSGHDWGLQR